MKIKIDDMATRRRLIKAILKGEFETEDFPELFPEPLLISVTWPDEKKNTNKNTKND